jgi:hypothetical protein
MARAGPVVQERWHQELWALEEGGGAEQLRREEVRFAELRDRNASELGPDHPQTLAQLRGLGEVLCRQRRWAEAEAVLADCLRRLKPTPPPLLPTQPTPHKDERERAREEEREREVRLTAFALEEARAGLRRSLSHPP